MNNENHIDEHEIVMDIDKDGKAYVVFYTDRLEKVPRLYLSIMEKVPQDKQDENIWYEGKPVAEILFSECCGSHTVEGGWILTEDMDNPTKEDENNQFLLKRFIKENRRVIEEAIDKYMNEGKDEILN